MRIADTPAVIDPLRRSSARPACCPGALTGQEGRLRSSAASSLGGPA